VNLKQIIMKLFFNTLIITVMFFSCSNSQNKQESTQNEKTNQQAIINKVKEHVILESITAGLVIDSLAGDNGIASWQVFNPKAYQNDDDIVGVVGSTESNIMGGKLTFKIVYLYQISSGKVIYYTGYMNDKEINEIEFVTSLEQKKMWGL